MTENLKQKRLSAVLIADIAEYTKLVERDTDGTVAAWTAARNDVIDPTIQKFSGRIVKHTGDGFLAEFATIQDAVSSAIAMQEGLSSSPLNFRIGVNLGDVVDDGQDIHGEGVNIAARIEALAEPGGITVAAGVFEQVRNRIDAIFEDLGEHSVKHVSAPIRVYKISIQLQTNNNTPSAIDQSMTITEEKDKPPKIALIPFENLNNDEESGYLVDGIVEDLITEFSMIKELEVLSRQSCFDFRNSNKNLDEFTEKFNLDFIVSGSVRTSGKRVRLSIQLNDPAADKVIWSNRYDRVMEDVFDLQDEVVRTVALALIGEIEITSLNRAKRKPTENITSYEFLLRGKELHHKFDKESNKKALEMFDNAITSDPNNAQAYAWKACTLGQAIYRNYTDIDAEILLEEGVNLIEKAHELNENDFECHRMLSAVYLSKHEYRLAEEHGRKAYEINPNDPRVVSGFGEVLVLVGKCQEGMEHLNKAYELDPVPQGQTNSDKRIADLVLGYFLMSNYEKCIETCKLLQELDIRSSIFRFYSLNQTGEYSSDNLEASEWKKSQNIEDWSSYIDRFHIVEKEKLESIKLFVSDIS